MSKRKISSKELKKFLEKNHDSLTVISKNDLKTLIKDKWPDVKVSLLPKTDYVVKLWVKTIIIPNLVVNTDYNEERVIHGLEEFINEVPLIRIHGLKIDDFKNAIMVDISSNKFEIDTEIKRMNVIQIIAEEDSKRIAKETKDKTIELEKKLIKRQEELLQVSTILKQADKIEFEEEDDIEIDQRPWWEIVGLTGDPFNKSGLLDIPKEGWESILINTPAVLFAKDFAKNQGNFVLGNNYMLAGEFGAGKSVVIDYMHDYATDAKIISFKVHIVGRSSIHQLLSEFFKHLWHQINKHIKSNERYQDEYGCCIGMNLILESRTETFDGFIILIEDLHKQADLEQAIEFISRLQSFQQILKTEKIKCSIIFTGLPYWKKEFKQSPNVTSVLSPSDVITIPEVTQKQATTAIKKRFEYFSEFNNHNYDIDNAYVRDLVIASDINHHTGFRLYFNSVKSKLQKGEYDLFTVNPVHLSEEMVEDSHTIASSYSIIENITRMYSKKIRYGKDSTVYEKELKIRLLASLIQKEFVKEDDPIFDLNNNKIILSHICKYNLINFNPDEKVWFPVHQLKELNQELIDKLQIPLSTTLLNWYILQTDRQRTTHKRRTLGLDYQENYDKWIIAVERLNPDLTKWAKKIDGEIADHIITHLATKTGYKRINIEKIFEIIENLSYLILDCENNPIRFIQGLRIPVMLRSRINATPSATDAIYRNYSGENYRMSSDQKRLFLPESFEVVKELQKTLINSFDLLQLIARDQAPGTPFTQLNKLDSDLVNIIRENEGMEQISGLCEIVQSSLRNYLWIASSIIFGSYSERKIVWSTSFSGAELNRMLTDSKKIGYLERNHNEYESLQRKGFKILLEISHKHEYYKLIVKDLIHHFSNKDIFKKNIDLFEKFDISVTHDKKGQLKHDLGMSAGVIFTFVRMARISHGLIVKKIRNYEILVDEDGGKKHIIFDSILSVLNFTKRKRDNTIVYNEEIKFFLHKLFIKVWPIHDGKMTEFLNTLFTDLSGYTYIDFTDYGRIRNIFGYEFEYGEAIGNLLYLEHINRIEFYQSSGSEMLIKKIQ